MSNADKSSREGYDISKPTIADNKKGGTINISVEGPLNEPVAIIQVNQYEHWVENERVRKSTRKGYISGPIDRISEIGWVPGDTTGGRIVIKETTVCPDHQNPEVGLSYREGKIRRYNGKCVYRVEYYSFSINDQDEFIDD